MLSWWYGGLLPWCGLGGGFGEVVVDWQWWVYGFGYCVYVGLLVVLVGLLGVSAGGTMMQWLLVA